MISTSMVRIASRALADALSRAGLLAGALSMVALLAAALSMAALPGAQAASALFPGPRIVEQSQDKSGGGLNKDWGSCAIRSCDTGR